MGIGDKTLAEFIIDLADDTDSLPAFQRKLEENGAEFSDSFTVSLHALIKRLRPSKVRSLCKLPVLFPRNMFLARSPISFLLDWFYFCDQPHKKYEMFCFVRSPRHRNRSLARQFPLPANLGMRRRECFLVFPYQTPNPFNCRLHRQRKGAQAQALLRRLHVAMKGEEAETGIRATGLTEAIDEMEGETVTEIGVETGTLTEMTTTMIGVAVAETMIDAVEEIGIGIVEAVAEMTTAEADRRLRPPRPSRSCMACTGEE